MLLFSVVYALWRKLRATTPDVSRRPAPRLPIILAALLLVAVACGIVRIWFPIDRWVNLLGFFRVAFSDVPRDLAFFIFGAMAFRHGWFESYSTRKGLAWLAVGVAAAIAMYAWRLIPHPGLAISQKGFAAAYLVWEELVAFGMCIGLLVLFRQAANVQGPFGKMLAANQYSAYFWHPTLIVGIQMVFVALPLGPLVKFIAVTALGVPVVFAWSWLLRRAPAVRAVL